MQHRRVLSADFGVIVAPNFIKISETIAEISHFTGAVLSVSA